MLVCLDAQHSLATGHLGARHADLSEARLIRVYAQHTARRLVELGHDVVLITEGDYPLRHAAVNGLGPDVYVACHVNAGVGDYALGLVLSGEHTGLCRAVVDRMSEEPEIRRGRYGLLSSSHQAGNRVGSLIAWGTRGTICIDGARCPSIIFEPGFIDSSEHAPLWEPEGLRRVGEALAEGLDRWEQEQ